MNIVFLDIDGVLNTDNYYDSLVLENEICGTKNIVRDDYGHFFDPTSVRWLKLILEKNHAKIVITSSWRFMGLDMMRNMWKERNLPGEIYGITEVMLNCYKDGIPTRGHEIRDFIHSHPEIDNYVILDDSYDFLNNQKEHVVIVDTKYGLDITAYQKANQIFLDALPW